MGKVLQRAGGGMTRADRGKLAPENIREGVTLFEGTAKEVTGEFRGFPFVINYLALRGGSDPLAIYMTFDVSHYKHLKFTYRAWAYAHFSIEIDGVITRLANGDNVEHLYDEDISADTIRLISEQSNTIITNFELS